jgi:diguanylate cyclase (GGDEF)-like protein
VPVEAVGAGASARLRRRYERERAARMDAERIAERATRELYAALEEARDAEARAGIVTEAAAGVFASGLDMPSTLRTIADAARRALGAERATLRLLADDGARVAQEFSTDAGGVGGRLPARSVSLHRLLRDPDALVPIEDLAAEGRGAGAALGVRLEHPSVTVDGAPAVLGVLVVDYALPRSFTPRDELAARSLAGLATLAIANARLHAATLASLAAAEHQASVDHLTGLANHRAFHDRLAREVARAEERGTPLSLVVMDIDHFKRVNDRHGHQVGDRVLEEAARRFARQTRATDLVGRIGGEEFALLLPGTEAADALRIAERMRAAVAAEPFAVAGALTVSAGVCDLARAAGAEELFRRADQALYRAKESGRDVSVVHVPHGLSATGPGAGSRGRRAGDVRAARAPETAERAGRRRYDGVAGMAARPADHRARPGTCPLCATAPSHPPGLLVADDRAAIAPAAPDPMPTAPDGEVAPLTAR